MIIDMEFLREIDREDCVGRTWLRELGFRTGQEFMDFCGDEDLSC